MLKYLRYALLPFSILYGIGVRLRNKMYDRGILHSVEFDIPLICVGNLSVGGTGKTPMVEYLIGLLISRKKVAVLSRGYKRKTKGFLMAGPDTTSREIGDEPMQVHLNFPDVPVAVAEERVAGIPQLLRNVPDVEMVILDDAFQHREVRAGLNILLTTYSGLYTRDLLLPAGNLRDTRSSSKRADIIVVTKCPDMPDQVRRDELIREINPLPHQQVYFTSVQYGIPYSFIDRNPGIPSGTRSVLLVCAIADPQPLKQAVNSIAGTCEYMFFRDHHDFVLSDIHEIRRRFDAIQDEGKIIITTEKDAVRLSGFKDKMMDIPVYVWPVKHHFIFNEAADFDRRITDFIVRFNKN